MSKKKVLFIGESWLIHTQESKGFDVFTFDSYETATDWIEKALTDGEFIFHHLPSHLVEKEFPATQEELNQYDAILLSDVGANTFQLPMVVFQKLKKSPNKLHMIREFTKAGGGFGMIGGYLTFMGIQGRGAYKYTAIEEILPVELLSGDDRMEHPEGVDVEILSAEHPVFQGLTEKVWPQISGYNKLIARPDAQVIASCCGDPFITLGTYGAGRTLAYATDCSPHWCPEEFCNWDGYGTLWRNLVSWLTQK